SLKVVLRIVVFAILSFLGLRIFGWLLFQLGGGLLLTSALSVFLAAAAANAALMRMPLPYFYQPVYWMNLLMADTVFIGAAIYCMVGLDIDLYLPYFLIILAAALTRSLARSVLVAVGVSAVYTWLMWKEGAGIGLLDSSFLIRLPFFIVIAIFTSYLAHGARVQEEAVAASRALSDQVSSLQQLAAGIAHEVRNPLTAISNSLQILMGRLPERDEDRDLAREALEQVNRVTRIVAETLELARPATLHGSWVDVNAMLERAVGDARRQAVSGPAPALAVQRRSPPGTLLLWGDDLLLEQALSNIVRNAVEAMPEGGALEIASEAGTKRGREHVFVRVRDAGGGIPPHQLEHLFQPFYTTKERGTGLGLCLARKAVRAHGGELTVSSEAGRGTTVRIELPVRGPASADAPLEGLRAQAPAGR
ncbi:MAG: ATP-binding protein, partial [bacterium]